MAAVMTTMPVPPGVLTKAPAFISAPIKTGTRRTEAPLTHRFARPESLLRKITATEALLTSKSLTLWRERLASKAGPLRCHATETTPAKTTLRGEAAAKAAAAEAWPACAGSHAAAAKTRATTRSTKPAA